MDSIDVENNLFQALPPEVFEKIVLSSILAIPALCQSCKYIDNNINLQMKQHLLLILTRSSSMPKEEIALANVLHRRWAAYLCKKAAETDNIMYVEQFTDYACAFLNIKDFNGTIVELVPTTQPFPSYKLVSKSQPKETEDTIDDIVKCGAIKVFHWFQEQYEKQLPDPAQRKHDPSYQLFSLRVMHACYVKFWRDKKKNRGYIKDILSVLEQHGDMLIRLLILFYYTEPTLYIDKKAVLIKAAAPLKALDYLKFLHKLHTDYSYKFDFVNYSPHCVEFGARLFGMSNEVKKLMTLRPMEACYLVQGTADTLKSLNLESDPSSAHIAIALFKRSVDTSIADFESVLLSKGANINAKIPEAFARIQFAGIPAETALGVLMLTQAKQHQWHLEWLSSNGAKFSEKEIEFVSSSNNPMLQKVLAITLSDTSYNLLANKASATIATNRTFTKIGNSIPRLVLDGDHFEYYKDNAMTYSGTYQQQGSKLVCQSAELFVLGYDQLHGSIGYGRGGGNKLMKSKEVFSFLILETCLGDHVLMILENENESDPKLTRPTYTRLTKILLWQL